VRIRCKKEHSPLLESIFRELICVEAGLRCFSNSIKKRHIKEAIEVYPVVPKNIFRREGGGVRKKGRMEGKVVKILKGKKFRGGKQLKNTANRKIIKNKRGGFKVKDKIKIKPKKNLKINLKLPQKIIKTNTKIKTIKNKPKVINKKLKNNEKLSIRKRKTI